MKGRKREGKTRELIFFSEEKEPSRKDLLKVETPVCEGKRDREGKGEVKGEVKGEGKGEEEGIERRASVEGH